MSTRKSTQPTNRRCTTTFEPITCHELGLVLKKIGYSHREFAEFLGRSRSYVSSIIAGRGEPPYRMIEALQEMVSNAWYTVALQSVREEERLLREREVGPS